MINDVDPVGVCQEPTPLVLRKESEIAGEGGILMMILA